MSVLAPPSSSLMATAALLLIAGGMLNGVSPNYRDMAPALRGLTSISYNRCGTGQGWEEVNSTQPVW